MNFFEKSGEVKYTGDILKLVGAEGMLYVRGMNILDYMTTDISVLEKRADIFADTVKTDGLYELIEYMVKQLEYVSEMVRKQSDIDNGERSLYSVKQLELYFDIVDRAEEFYALRHGELGAEFYRELFSKLHEIALSGEYEGLKKGTRKLMADITRVKSISIGFNFNSTLSPYEAGVLSVNPYYIESGDLIDRILRTDLSKNDMSLAPLVPAKPACRDSEFNAMEAAIYTAMNKIFKKQIKQWESRINSYMGERLGFLLDALPDFRIIVKIVSIQNSIQAACRKLSLKLKKPTYRPMEERVFRGYGMYNPTLAVKIAERGEGVVIKNDFTFDEHGAVYLLTGPNNGGKSVFMSCVCIIQIMAQLGMMTPAAQLEISPVSGIFIHFQQYSAINERGRLADECIRIAGIFKEADQYSVAFFDEAFSSTDVRDAVSLSDNVLRALMYKKLRAVYSTHMHELEAYTERINEEFGGGLDYLTAGITESGIRTYRIERTKPSGESWGQSVAEKYGVSYEELISG